MEFIKINDEKYFITEASYVNNNLIKIIFEDETPSDFSTDFEVYTAGGRKCSDICGFHTIYKSEDNVFYLSNDGSVWTAPIEPPITVRFTTSGGGHLEGEVEFETESFDAVSVPTPVPADNYRFIGWSEEIPVTGPVEESISFTAMFEYVPTIEEIRAQKKAEISTICEQIIYDGIDIGEEHFSLTQHDQLNLFGKQVQLAAGAELLEYHADGQPCKYYTALEMQNIIETAMQHVSYHTTRCNALNMWIAGSTDKEEIKAITYDSVIPEQYQSEVFRIYEERKGE